MINHKVKEKKCKICKEKFQPKRPLQFICGMVCAKEYARQQSIKQGVKALQKRHKELKETVRNNDKKTRLRAAKEACHLYIRIRDSLFPCISCGKTEALDWHASHFYESGNNSALRYHEINIHKSCSECNTHGHGNLIGYRKGIIERYGQDYMNELDALKEKGTDKKWSVEELKEIETYYKFKLVELKLQNF